MAFNLPVLSVAENCDASGFIHMAFYVCDRCRASSSQQHFSTILTCAPVWCNQLAIACRSTRKTALSLSTMCDIVRVFRGLERYEVQRGEQVTLIPAKLRPLQHQLLQWLEVPASLYQ